MSKKKEVNSNEILNKFDIINYKKNYKKLMVIPVILFLFGLMSDVPISILLSGGVDSALITQLANKVSGKTGFDSFTAGTEIVAGILTE